MQKLLATIILMSVAHAHVPVITPSDHPQGDRPPKLEEGPLPPVIFDNPISHVPIIFMPVWFE